MMLSTQPLMCSSYSALRIRLVPQTLREDESLSSLMDHQAQLWGLSRNALATQVSALSATAALEDLDVCRSKVYLDDYAEASGMDATELHARRVQHPKVLLGHRSRHAYCPLCFRDDLYRGEVPYFRVDWARMLLTHCRAHRSPLFRWRMCSTDGLRKLPNAWFMGSQLSLNELAWFRDDLEKATAYWMGTLPHSPPSRAMWNTLLEFESDLVRKGVGGPWYYPKNGAYGLESKIMETAVKLVRPIDGNPEHSMIKTMQPDYEDHDMLAFTLRRHRDRSINPSWRELRVALTSLPCRRSVLLVTSQTL